MTDNQQQNEMAAHEPLSQILERHSVPQGVIAHILALQGQLADFYFQQRNPERTITLHCTGARDNSSWYVIERDAASHPLDSREALAQVACMLLGAPHPALDRFDDIRKRSYRQREVIAGLRDRLDETTAQLAGATGNVAGLTEHLDYANKMAKESKRAADAWRGIEWHRFCAAVSALGAPIGCDVLPWLLEYVEAQAKTAATAAGVEHQQLMADVVAGSLEFGARVAALRNDLDDCELPRTAAEIELWPEAWLVDAQNWALAWKAWDASWDDAIPDDPATLAEYQSREPKPPAFLDGDVEADALTQRVVIGVDHGTSEGVTVRVDFEANGSIASVTQIGGEQLASIAPDDAGTIIFETFSTDTSSTSVSDEPIGSEDVLAVPPEFQQAYDAGLAIGHQLGDGSLSVAELPAAIDAALTNIVDATDDELLARQATSIVEIEAYLDANPDALNPERDARELAETRAQIADTDAALPNVVLQGPLTVGEAIGEQCGRHVDGAFCSGTLGRVGDCECRGDSGPCKACARAPRCDMCDLATDEPTPFDRETHTENADDELRALALATPENHTIEAMANDAARLDAADEARRTLTTFRDEAADDAANGRGTT